MVGIQKIDAAVDDSKTLCGVAKATPSRTMSILVVVLKTSDAAMPQMEH